MPFSDKFFRLKSRKTRASLQIVLSIIAVIGALEVNWIWLREIHVHLLIFLLNLSHIPVYSSGKFALAMTHVKIILTTPCTSVEAVLGALPLIWNKRWSFFETITKFAIFFLVFEFLNILRIFLGLVFFAKGTSWFYSHEIPSGLFYFLLLRWTLHTGNWVIRDPKKYRLLTIPE